MHITGVSLSIIYMHTGLLRAIDGSHLPIPTPKEHHGPYINRKNYHSILLQALCDGKTIFLDVYSGEPGSIHDSNLFKQGSQFP